MGLFDLFKRKKKVSLPKMKIEVHAYDENGNEVPLHDDIPIPDDIDIDPETYDIIKKEIRPLEKIMIGHVTSLNKDTKLDDRIHTLECAISSYNALHQKCYSMGGKYTKYMQKFWENARKDSKYGPGYIDLYIKQLQNLKDNYDKLKTEENARYENLPNLRENLLIFLSENTPILQTQIYKSFDPSVKEDIRDIIYFLEKDGLVKREKSGNTYVVTYIGK